MSHRSQHECFTGSQDLQDRPRLSRGRRALRQMSCRFKQNTLYWNSYLEDDIPRLKGCDFRNRHRLLTALAISIEPVS